MNKKLSSAEQKSAVCSIDEFYDDLLQQESMRKSNIKCDKHRSPLQVCGDWEDREFLDIYISPFQSIQSKSKSLKNSVKKDNQEQTTLKKEIINSMQENTAIHDKKQRKSIEKQEIKLDYTHFKSVLSKKNRIIEELRAQVRFLITKINLQYLKNVEKLKINENSLCKTGYEFAIGKDIILYHKLEEQKAQQQKQFLQKNNVELFMNLSKQKRKTQHLKQCLENQIEANQKLKKQLQSSKQQIKMLKSINEKLLKNTEEYLSSGKKQIKMFKKIKSAFTEKKGIYQNVLTEENVNKPKHSDSLEKTQRRKAGKTVDVCKSRANLNQRKYRQNKH